MSNKSVVLLKPKAVTSTAPRVAVGKNSTRYEFGSLQAVNKCLQDGTFVLRVYASGLGDDGKVIPAVLNPDGTILKKAFDPRFSIKGCFSEGAWGDIHVALSAKVLQLKPFQSTKHLFYPLLQTNDPDFMGKADTCDTQSDFNIFNNFIGEHLRAACDQYYPDESGALNEPKALKLKIPVSEAISQITPEGRTDLSEAFDYNILMTKPGKLMMKIGNPWMMPSIRSEGSRLIGVSFVLDKAPYLTDAQQQEVKEAKAAAKLDAEVADESVGGKRRRANAEEDVHPAKK